jgi:hypothetical protein
LIQDVKFEVDKNREVEIIDPKAKTKVTPKDSSPKIQRTKPQLSYEQSLELRKNKQLLKKMEAKYEKMEAYLARLDAEKAFLKTNDRQKKIVKPNGNVVTKMLKERKR